MPVDIKEQYIKYLIYIFIGLLIILAMWGVLMAIQPRTGGALGAGMNIIELLTFELKAICSIPIPGC